MTSGSLWWHDAKSRDFAYWLARLLPLSVRDTRAKAPHSAGALAAVGLGGNQLPRKHCGTISPFGNWKVKFGHLQPTAHCSLPVYQGFHGNHDARPALTLRLAGKPQTMNVTIRIAGISSHGATCHQSESARGFARPGPTGRQAKVATKWPGRSESLHSLIGNPSQLNGTGALPGERNNPQLQCHPLPARVLRRPQLN